MTVRYSTGDAWLIATTSVVLLLPEDRSTRDVGELWRALMGEPDVLTVLDLLGGGRIAQLPAFGCLVVSEGEVHVLTRGPVSVTRDSVSGHEGWDGQGVATWAERRWLSAEVGSLGMRIGPRGRPDLPLAEGVVKASAVAWTLPGAEQNAAVLMSDPVVTDEPEPVFSTTNQTPPGEIEQTELEQTEPEDAGSAPDGETAGAQDDAAPDDAAPDDAPPRSLGAADPAQTLVEPDDEMEALFGETVSRSTEDAAIREEDEPSGLITGPPGSKPAPATPAADDAADVVSDHFGNTIARRRMGRPVAGPEQQVRSTSQRDVRLHLFNGETLHLVGRILVGRAPKALNTALMDVPRLITVDDPSFTVSGTHVEFTVTDGTPLVRDLSTNGTVLTRPGRDPERIKKNDSVVLTDGSVVSLGAGFEIVVEIKRGDHG